ncbi:MAG: MFS transporter [Phycisphaerales bacterium]|nr:MFS transporter [Phycisphaerales bacterium]
MTQMVVERSVGRPRIAGVIAAHVVVLGTLSSTWMATQIVLPVIAKKSLGANAWQLLAITATPTVFFVLSVFWNAVFARLRIGTYLAIYWACTAVPIALMGLAESFWWMLLPQVVASIGSAAYHPVAGELLRGLYSEKVRGRVYGVLYACSLVVSAGVGFGFGRWLNVDDRAYRLFLPIVAGVQGVGVLVAWWLARSSGVSAAKTARGGEGAISGQRLDISKVFEPIAHLRAVLKADPVFARYEGAYMTYGAGWMITYALLPILVVDKLKLDYATIMERTHVAYLLAMLLMLAPAGFLMDRLGAMKSVGLSFGMLTVYPVMLAFAPDADWLLAASIAYGIAHAGASVGWMLGPVTLAPSPDKAAQYVAIHATLVGVRGILLQFAGVALYKMTGNFTVPLLVAAGAYAWSAVQRWRLDRRVRAGRAV